MRFYSERVAQLVTPTLMVNALAEVGISSSKIKRWRINPIMIDALRFSHNWCDFVFRDGETVMLFMNIPVEADEKIPSDASALKLVHMAEKTD